jgi:hypothetical protein
MKLIGKPYINDPKPSRVAMWVSLLNAPLPEGEGQGLKLEVDHVQLG